MRVTIERVGPGNERRRRIDEREEGGIRKRYGERTRAGNAGDVAAVAAGSTDASTDVEK